MTPQSTLLDLLSRFSRLKGREAVRFDNGFRHWVWSYRDFHHHVAGFARHLSEQGLGRGDRLLLWCENRPEWLAAFWGCLARGVQVVPVDYRFSPGLVGRIQQEVGARLLVYGSEVQPSALDLPALPAAAMRELVAEQLDAIEARPDDVVQIVYTSGTTGRPRGVVHRHANLCSNLAPIASEIERYRHWARPFQPIRLLSLLPLSHVFGQAVALYVPPLLGGAAVFMSDLHPQSVIRVIRQHRVSVWSGVPRMLEGLRQEVARQLPPGEVPALGRGWSGALRRWWAYRRVHRRFGWKFWSFVVGGAPVPGDLERFWSRLGFAVIQGYGLTETSPVVAVNHPFDARLGSIGRAIAGQEVRLAPDGEILVRGESVATEFLGGEAPSGTRLEDGWLHTGDLGELGEDGSIYFRGRKKDLIVTAAGLNVFPQDVEQALRQSKGVRDCTVVGIGEEGSRVHAALILEEGAEAESAVREANRRLEPHQRIQGWTLWPELDFPRTASTFKVRRAEVARRIAGRPGEAPASGSRDPVEAALQALGAGTPPAGERLDQDLGLTSLDRVELLSRLEDRFSVRLDESRFADLETLEDLRREVEGARRSGSLPDPDRQPLTFPGWAGRLPVRWLRGLFREVLFLPAQRRLVRVRAEGLENLAAVQPPVLLAANHASHLDTPAVLAALPRRWRGRMAPAMRQEYFAAHFQPEAHPWKARWRTTLKYLLACGLFQGYPLPQRLGGIRGALEFTGRLVQRGACPLIFPEGIRSADGTLAPFRQGVGLMALRLAVPVVPVRIEGTLRIWPKQERRPVRKGEAVVRFGRPLDLSGCQDPTEAAALVEQAVRGL